MGVARAGIGRIYADDNLAQADKKMQQDEPRPCRDRRGFLDSIASSAGAPSRMLRKLQKAADAMTLACFRVEYRKAVQIFETIVRKLAAMVDDLFFLHTIDDDTYSSLIRYATLALTDESAMLWHELRANVADYDEVRLNVIDQAAIDDDVNASCPITEVDGILDQLTTSRLMLACAILRAVARRYGLTSTGRSIESVVVVESVVAEVDEMLASDLSACGRGEYAVKMATMIAVIRDRRVS